MLAAVCTAVACGDATSPAPVASLTVLSGSGQTVLAGQELPEPVVVRASMDGAPQPGEFIRAGLWYVEPAAFDQIPVLEAQTNAEGVVSLRPSARARTGAYEVRIEWFRCNVSLGGGCASRRTIAQTTATGTVIAATP